MEMFCERSSYRWWMSWFTVTALSALQVWQKKLLLYAIKNKIKKHPHIMCFSEATEDAFILIFLLACCTWAPAWSRQGEPLVSGATRPFVSKCHLGWRYHRPHQRFFRSSFHPLLQPHWNAALETSESTPHISLTPRTSFPSLPAFSMCFHVLPGLKWKKKR